MSDLRALFPAEPHRFRVTLRRGEPAEFFRAQDDSGDLLRERTHWLTQAPARYARLRTEGEPLFEELRQTAAGWGMPPAGDLAALGRVWEPDILLLSRDEAGQFRLQGGVLCFPTSWALEEKMGRTLEDIHGVVPGLNPAIGASIRQLLANLKPGPAFLRDNWGIAATAALNLHPAQSCPRPALPLRLDHLWLRVEHQALVALPRTRGLLFGIRIALHRLDHLQADEELRRGLGRALRSMSPALIEYKGLTGVRSSLVQAFDCGGLGA